MSAATLTLAEVEAMIAEPVRDHSYEITALGPSVRDYLRWKELEDGAAPRTIDSYERVLARMCVRLASRSPEEVSTDDLRRVRDSYPKGSLRPATSPLKDFWKWMYDEERIPSNPMGRVRYPKRTQEIRIDIFSEAEYEALTAQPELRDGALCLLLLDSGIRKDEAINLQVLHVSLEEGYLTVVRGKGRKGRVVPISERCVRKLAALSLVDGLEPEDYLWYSSTVNRYGRWVRRGRPISASTFQAWWERCVETVGVLYRKQHTTRHTFASRWLRDGGNIAVLSRLLGHTSIATTVDLYGHFGTGDLAAEVARLAEIRAAREKAGVSS